MIQTENLKQLIEETMKLYADFSVPAQNVSEVDVTYLLHGGDMELGLQCGLYHDWKMQQARKREQSVLRKNSKTYRKIFRQNQHITKIESYVKEKLDVVFWALHQGEFCYLFPFSKEGFPYPTYCYVTHSREDRVTEEYMVTSDQILYERYVPLNPTETMWEFVDYVPGGTHAVRSYAKGIFTQSDSLMLTMLEKSAWQESGHENLLQTVIQ